MDQSPPIRWQAGEPSEETTDFVEPTHLPKCFAIGTEKEASKDKRRPAPLKEEDSTVGGKRGRPILRGERSEVDAENSMPVRTVSFCDIAAATDLDILQEIL